MLKYFCIVLFFLQSSLTVFAQCENCCNECLGFNFDEGIRRIPKVNEEYKNANVKSVTITSSTIDSIGIQSLPYSIENKIFLKNGRMKNFLEISYFDIDTQHKNPKIFNRKLHFKNDSIPYKADYFVNRFYDYQKKNPNHSNWLDDTSPYYIPCYDFNVSDSFYFTTDLHYDVNGVINEIKRYRDGNILFYEKERTYCHDFGVPEDYEFKDVVFDTLFQLNRQDVIVNDTTCSYECYCEAQSPLRKFYIKDSISLKKISTTKLKSKYARLHYTVVVTCIQGECIFSDDVAILDSIGSPCDKCLKLHRTAPCPIGMIILADSIIVEISRNKKKQITSIFAYKGDYKNPTVYLRSMFEYYIEGGLKKKSVVCKNIMGIETWFVVPDSTWLKRNDNYKEHISTLVTNYNEKGLLKRKEYWVHKLSEILVDEYQYEYFN